MLLMSDSSVPGYLSFKRNVIQVSGRGFSCTEPERSIRPTSMRFAGVIGIKCCIGMSVMIHHRSCRQAPNGIKAEHRILEDATGKTGARICQWLRIGSVPGGCSDRLSGQSAASPAVPMLFIYHRTHPLSIDFYFQKEPSECLICLGSLLM